jgi:REP element-mobilizing transposase RayT
MPNPKISLEAGNYYHIYNRGINACNIFSENDNYRHFLHLYDTYISPVANTLAWVLMKNHFHLLVQILPSDKWGKLTSKGSGILVNMDTDKRINQQFSNLFNAYTKAFNKRYNRTGSLFEHSFRRKLVDNNDYLKQAILYIHFNPVKHNFCSHPAEYPWSSYLSCISLKSTKLQRKTVIGLFNSEAEFVSSHNQYTQAFTNFDWIDL